MQQIKRSMWHVIQIGNNLLYSKCIIHINIDKTTYKGILLNQDIRFQNLLCKYEL